MSISTFQQRKGTSEVYTIALGRNDGATLSYTGAEVPTFRLWPGEGWPTVLSIDADWLDPPNTVDVPISAADLEPVEPGEYLAELLFDGGEGGIGWTGRFKVDAAPAEDAEPLRTYCSRADLIAELPALANGNYRQPTDGLNFERQRHAAAEWLEDALHARYRPDAYCWYPTSAGSRARDWWPSGTPGRSPDLAQWIEEGRVVVTPHLRRACTYHALGLILLRQFAAGHEESIQRKMGRQYAALAETELKSLVVEIDLSTPLDGRGDLSIDLGRVS